MTSQRSFLQSDRAEASNEVTSFMDSVMNSETADDFYFYEPWDPDEPEDKAHGFQAAFHLSTDRIRCANAANRTGKSLMDAVEIICMLTGEIPHSMRYPRGHVTEIPRPWKDIGQDSIGRLNQIRFGFKDPETREWTPPDKWPDTPDPGWPVSAPCGYIVGSGEFPQEKISKRRRDSIWVCTWKQVKDERWIDLLAGLIPSQYLDIRFGKENGYSEKNNKFMLTNGNTISIITYEMGWKRIQGANVWAIFYDEEPDDRRFWTEGDQRLIGGGNDGWMVLSYTPLAGLSWSYNDLYTPIRAGKMERASLYHATQYDSPYITLQTISYRVNNNYKPWEIEARVYGRFSEMEGRPYYDWEKLNKWKRSFVPRFDVYHIVPNVAYDYDMMEVIKGGAHRLPGTDNTGTGWEFYEEAPFPDRTYFISADTAEGSETEDQDRDRSVAYVFRKPLEDEDQAWPIRVAALRTNMETFNFGRELIYAGMLFNYATLVPEVKGTTGGEVLAEIREYPFIYRMVVVDDYTRKPKKKLGFDMNIRTRRTVFDLTGDFINDRKHPQSLVHYFLLKEASELITGKKGRPDHPDRGTSDCIIADGIGRYVYRFDRDQLQNHRDFLDEFQRQENQQKKFARYLNDDQPRKNSLGSKNWRSGMNAPR